jgi:hypothetical protein
MEPWDAILMIFLICKSGEDKALNSQWFQCPVLEAMATAINATNMA